MQDQQTCEFHFKITTVNIVISPSAQSSLKSRIYSSGSQSNASSKSVLVKLGNKEGKCKVLGQTLEMNVDVTYSKTFKKFYPIKLIVKIYEVARDGKQMILGIEALKTQEFLTQGSKVVNLQKDIGPCKMEMKIQAINMTSEKSDKEIQTKPNLYLQTNESKSKSPIQHKNFLNDEKKEDKKFLKSPKISESDHSENPAPYMIDDSDLYDQNSKSRCSEKSDEVKFNEKQIIGQQLLEERRKNKVLEQKIEKNNIKIQLLKKNLSVRNNQLKNYYQNFKNFSSALEFDLRGQYIFEMNEKKREISLKYKSNIKFKQIFEQFISFMVRKLAEGNSLFVGSERSIEDEVQVNKILSKIEIFDQQKQKASEQNLKLMTEVTSLKNLINQKNIQLSTKDILLKKKTEQISCLQQKIRKLNDQKRGLDGLNQYLQERDNQMQTIISTKQNTIESLKKMITDHNFEVDSLEQKNSKLVKIVQNLQLRIDEMKQQNSNLSQTIESYRLSYGDLKTAKDKALQRQFKECLRWIDQQNHEQDLNIEETEPSENPTVNSLMKSIGQIQNLPLQEISQIRKEVINVLKRLDQFVARNSFVGISP